MGWLFWGNFSFGWKNTYVIINGKEARWEQVCKMFVFKKVRNPCLFRFLLAEEIFQNETIALGCISFLLIYNFALVYNFMGMKWDVK